MRLACSIAWMHKSAPTCLQPEEAMGMQARRLGRARMALLVALVASLPVAFAMPARWGWENSWIENAQVFVLVGGFAACVASMRRASGRSDRALWLGIAPIWLLIAARELSWGAVFADPIAFTADGPQFSSNTLWFKHYVYGIAGVVLAACALLLAVARLDRVIGRMLRAGTFPWAETLVVLLVALASSLAEGHLGLDADFLGAQAQVMEELVELVGYLALVLAQGWVAWATRAMADNGH
ncbi:hypothetical protein DES41_1011253 [Pseudorhodoferax soli]|uniref:Uncharacterized protein n=2 Tax=Pseudorhodoferax soli TaxID=545864 RepID=A0A368YEN8_9BURK|nr:hypothetical protein DES41_1011253 [Pseudorhodoferax soli]